MFGPVYTPVKAGSLNNFYVALMLLLLGSFLVIFGVKWAFSQETPGAVLIVAGLTLVAIGAFGLRLYLRTAKD